ncbi:MAG TPA: ATP-binding cassette domain-containing protein [Planctomycetota bacterium]|nr:ATP-binding cassette domain-containing protein [Planctomycetota bacterium]
MIEVSGLTKFYGDFPALRDVTFSVPKGEILAFLGPNGAGKSTTMKILTGYISPSAGRATVAGTDVIEHPLDVRRRIGYLPETTPLYYDMQVDEFLGFTARLRGIPAHARRGRLAWVAEMCHLDAFWKRPIGVLSRGQKQRVGFAQAILHDPEVLILDEPTAGLDPNQILDVRALIRRFSQVKTIILSTHILQEVDALSDHVVIVNEGKIVADTHAGELRRQHGSLEQAFHALTRGGAGGSGEPLTPAAPAEGGTDA